MFLDRFFSTNEGRISFSRQQASDFAKTIADDFNPIHDVDAKRFCVPGDLLFAVVLGRYGLSQHMRFTFSGMVADGVPLNFPVTDDSRFVITDEQGREYLGIERSGAVTTDPQTLAGLTRCYVAFSGMTFPHILVPLMAQHQVMINPERPLVVYESMVIDMTRLGITDPVLHLTESSLDVQGKRGNIRLKFQLTEADEPVGSGEKNMVLSGLRPFEQAAIDQLVNEFNSRKLTTRAG